MKRKIYLIYGLYIILISAVLVSGADGAETKKLKNPDIYYVDSHMLKLVPVELLCKENSVEGQAKAVISQLIEGKDKNRKIRRMIPDIKNCLTVKVEDDTAYVDIAEKSIKYFPDGRIAEELVVFQIVNSLTSIEGIVKVKFTIDKKPQKSFKGFIDMRETFIPDYYV